ncbi:MAG: glycosyl transferase family 2 [Chloroflexi bacterium]|nr:glycosyl transferase family 2 [Chloroflexota bacterium]
MKPDVSAVIVTFQSEGWIGRCLSAVQTNARAGVEIVVVDNASTDRTIDVVRTSAPHATLISLDRNRGFAAAANIGAASSTAGRLLFLNPDAEIQGGAIDALGTFLNANPTAAAAGPRFLSPDGSPQDSAFTYPTLLMTWLEFFHRPARLLRTRWNGRLASPNGQPIFVDYPLGACMLVKHAAWEDVGPFDERFVLYCEEVDWCVRAKQKGWDIAHVPSAVVIHEGGASAASARASSLAHLYASRRYLHRKHRGNLYRAADAVIMRIGLNHERRRLSRLLATHADDDVAERLRGIELALQRVP